MNDSRKRILVLTQLYAPEPNFITQDVANAFAEMADVTVITAFPNYPLDHFYDDKRHWIPRRTREGKVTVWRVPMIPDRSRSQFRRFLCYVSFSAWAAVVAPFVAGSADLVWVYNTPFSIGVGALWFKWIFRARLLFTYSDLWPESFLAAGVSRPGRLVSFLFWSRSWINRKADEIIGSTRGTVARFARDGISPEKLHYVPVWVQGIRPLETSADIPNRIVYVGNMGKSQNLDPVIEGAALLVAEGVDVAIDLYGYGIEEERLREKAARLGATNVTFHGRISPDEAFEQSSRAVGQVVTLAPDPMFEMTIPSKLPFCFAAGAPVLYSLKGEPAEVARRSGAGFAFDDGKTFAAQVRALLALRPDERRVLHEQLTTFYRREFSRDRLLDRYREIASAMLDETPA